MKKAQIIKLFIGFILIQIAVDSDMFFSQDTSKLFTIQYFVELFFMMAGAYFFTKYNVNERTINSLKETNNEAKKLVIN